MSPALWFDCGCSTVITMRLLASGSYVSGEVLVRSHSRTTLRWSGTTPVRSQGPGGSAGRGNVAGTAGSRASDV